MFLTESLSENKMMEDQSWKHISSVLPKNQGGIEPIVSNLLGRHPITIYNSVYEGSMIDNKCNKSKHKAIDFKMRFPKNKLLRNLI